MLAAVRVHGRTGRIRVALLVTGIVAVFAASARPGSAAVPVTASGPSNTAGDFTLVLVPDTQNYTSSAANRPIMGRQTQWIVDSRQRLNTAFVAHLGDLVGVESNVTQWQAASAAMATLDNAGVPNAVLPGNHDLDLTTGAGTRYQQYFPVSRYAGASWNSATASYGGYLGQNQFGADPVNRQNLDNYALFTAGGMDFLLLSLEFDPPDYVIDWARKILAAYPERRAIVSTHSYVDVSGGLSTQMDRADAGNSPAQLWSKLIAPSCRIFLVVNGHFHDGDRSEARRTDTNACGGTVQSVLSDYQARANGGNGWLRYYTFHPAANQIQAVTYSPTLDAYETDADSAFTLPYDMSRPGPATALARDGFGRTVSNAWGGADTGGAWTTTGGAARFSVADGAGVSLTAAGGTTTAALGPLAATATDTSVVVRMDSVPNAVTHLSVAGRRVGSSVYAAKVRVAAGGATDLRIYRDNTDLTAGVPFGSALAPGQRLAVRIQVDGTAPTRIRARAWKVGTTEPTGWTVAATDSTANLQTSGGVSLSTYLSSTATTGPVTVRWDDLLVAPIAGVALTVR